MTMVTFSLVSLIGVAPSFRFSVMILFPTIGIALLYVACIGVGRGNPGSEVVLTMILSASALQIGNLLGIVARAIVLFLVAPATHRILGVMTTVAHRISSARL
jgi:hypothetical protein